MIEVLKDHIIKASFPVGEKKTSHWKLPPKSFFYGYPVIPDKEDASTITRSWKTHSASRRATPPQDFVQINKMAIKMNATTFATNKDFRRNVNIKQMVRTGSVDRFLCLPPEDFAYGYRYVQPNPIKDLINNAYGNKAEKVIEKEYGSFIKEKQGICKLAAKTTVHWDKLLKLRKERPTIEEKPLYKLKMFQKTPSRVAQRIKEFKTYGLTIDNTKNRPKTSLDHLINTVQHEVDAYDQK